MCDDFGEGFDVFGTERESVVVRYEGRARKEGRKAVLVFGPSFVGLGRDGEGLRTYFS